MRKYQIKDNHLNIIRKAILGTGWDLDISEEDLYSYVGIRDGANIVTNASIGEIMNGKTSEDLLFQIMEGLTYWTAEYLNSKKQ